MPATPYFSDESVTLHHGDCLEVLRGLPDDSIDSVVTDPPYGLEFMGREWDSFKPADAKIRTRIDGRTNGAEKSTVSTPESYRAGMPFQLWCTEWATECLRVLKPGGHMVAFGGSRTWHRLASAVEDSGFEIRDSIAWLYGSGFPKSMDVSKALDKAAGVTRDVVGVNPHAAQQTAKSDTTTLGAFAGTPAGLTAPTTEEAKQWEGWGTALKPAFEPIVVARKPLTEKTVAGNVLAHGTGALNIDASRVAGSKPATTRGASVNQSSMVGALGGQGRIEDDGKGRFPANVVLDPDAAEALDEQGGSVGAHSVGKLNKDYSYTQRNQVPSDQPFTYGDKGGASRFFPTFHYEAKAPTSERPNVQGVQHPTVKPLDLMRWLVRLVTPPNGVVLEPFAGSGTTIEACIHEHMSCIAIEREDSYLPLILARITKPIEVGFDFGQAS